MSHPCPELANLLGELRRSGLRVTEPRKAILNVFVRDHGPFTAEEIHLRVTQKVCDLATVYRSLTSLEEAGLLRRCELGDGIARYEILRQHHHHHVVCLECRKIEVLDDCELKALDRFAERRGFANVSHSLEFFGLCPDCR